MERRRNAVYLIIILGLLAGLISGKEIFFNIAYAFVGLLLVSFLWTWSSANWLRLRRQTHTRRTHVGSYLEETFTVRNVSVLPKLWLEIHDRSDLLGHRAGHVISNLWPRAEASWSARTLCVRRGTFQLGPLRLVTGDPFGLFQAERHFSATTPLVVYPPVFEIAEFSLPVGLLRGSEALRRRTHQITPNAAGVRDYMPGDSLNRIHWRSTARKSRLIVKEFELDPLADIWIALDAEGAVHAGAYRPTAADVERLTKAGPLPFTIPPTTEEYAIAIAASLAHYFIQHERSVGFAVHGQRREIVQADRGERQLIRILDILAVIEARGTVTFDQFLTLQADQMPRGTTVVLITPSTRERLISAVQGLLQRRLRVAAILVDAASFGGRPGVEQTAARLALLRVPVYIVRRGDSLQAALSHPYF